MRLGESVTYALERTGVRGRLGLTPPSPDPKNMRGGRACATLPASSLHRRLGLVNLDLPRFHPFGLGQREGEHTLVHPRLDFRNVNCRIELEHTTIIDRTGLDE